MSHGKGSQRHMKNNQLVSNPSEKIIKAANKMSNLFVPLIIQSMHWPKHAYFYIGNGKFLKNCNYIELKQFKLRMAILNLNNGEWQLLNLNNQKNENSSNWKGIK